MRQRPVEKDKIESTKMKKYVEKNQNKWKSENRSVKQKHDRPKGTLRVRSSNDDN